jgi:hypothetical protein
MHHVLLRRRRGVWRMPSGEKSVFAVRRTPIFVPESDADLPLVVANLLLAFSNGEILERLYSDCRAPCMFSVLCRRCRTISFGLVGRPRQVMNAGLTKLDEVNDRSVPHLRSASKRAFPVHPFLMAVKTGQDHLITCARLIQASRF